MVQSAALTRRLTGALPDQVSGVRWHRKVSHVPRRNRAAERSTRRKGTERHVAVAREGGRILDGHCAAARGNRAGPTIGRACRTQQAVARGLVRDKGKIRCRSPVRGSARRPECRRLAGQVSSGHAAAAACDGEGIRVEGRHRNSLRNPDDLPGRERIAHHNLALRPVPRPRGAAGGQRSFGAPSAPFLDSARQFFSPARRRIASDAFSGSVGTRSLTPRMAVIRFPAVSDHSRRRDNPASAPTSPASQ